MAQRAIYAYDPRIERRHNRLAIIWLTVLMVVALVSLVGEFYLLNRFVTTHVSDMLNHLITTGSQAMRGHP